MQNGRITSLLRYPQRKVPAVEESQMVLIENLGIEGDCHAEGGERQISLLTAYEKEWMKQQDVKGFCFKKYKENVLMDGICLQDCKSGDCLICGETVMELTCSLKSCHIELCELAANGKKCILAGSTRFAKVKKGGVIQKGMKITLEKKV